MIMTDSIVSPAAAPAETVRPTVSDLDLAMFVLGLPEAEQGAIDLTTETGANAAIELYFRSLEKKEEPAPEKVKGERKAREAQEYAVLVLIAGPNKTGTVRYVGKGLAAPGREAKDPAQWSPVKKYQTLAEALAVTSTRGGKPAQVLTIPAHDVKAFLAAMG